jgi:23S rRNA maturation-related 3'-5' exoribonuclease YhaM
VVNRDVVLAGALLHDVGKAWEVRAREPQALGSGQIAVRIPVDAPPVYGAHICITVGLPEEIAHIALGHSYEGDLMMRSLECTIVHRADHLWWSIAGGLRPAQAEGAAMLEGRKITPRALRDTGRAS